MTYTEKHRKSFGNQQHGRSPWRGSGKAKHDTALARKSFEGRSKRSQIQDLHKFAEVTSNITAYLRSPNELDWQGVDTPSKLAELARKGNDVELIVKDGSSKKDKPKTHRYKITMKEKAQKELKKKQEELKKADVVMFNIPLAESSHKLPSEAEILSKAQSLYMAEHSKGKYENSEPEVLPTKTELREEGYLQAAKLDLMTSQDTQASRKVLDYVDGLRGELEKIGFTIEPISGFDVSDLQY